MNPSPRGHEINGRLFLGQFYDNLCLLDLCLGIEKKIFKEIMDFRYMNYTREHKNHYPGRHLEFR